MDLDGSKLREKIQISHYALSFFVNDVVNLWKQLSWDCTDKRYSSTFDEWTFPSSVYQLGESTFSLIGIRINFHSYFIFR